MLGRHGPLGCDLVPPDHVPEGRFEIAIAGQEGFKELNAEISPPFYVTGSRIALFGRRPCVAFSGARNWISTHWPRAAAMR